MHAFIEAVSVAGAIAAAVVASVVVLTLCYRGLAWLGSGETLDSSSMLGIAKKGTLATVHVAGRKPFERVRIVGVTKSEEVKTNLRWQPSGMVVLEDEAVTRYTMRAKEIKMIVVPSDRLHSKSAEFASTRAGSPATSCNTSRNGSAENRYGRWTSQ